VFDILRVLSIPVASRRDGSRKALEVKAEFDAGVDCYA
jgi:hypothetical protein